MEEIDKLTTQDARRKARFLYLASCVPLFALVAFAVWFALPSSAQQLVYVTGEEGRFQQLRGLWNLALDQTRPPLQLARDAQIANLPANQFGANTFLEQEVEISKRERSLQLLRDAGITWIRQPFTWSDIEIHAKGDFEDRRNEPYRSAWDKYDNIVALSETYSMTIVARLGAPPAWAHAGFADLGDFGPPAKFEDFADFAVALAQRYTGRIRHYQIWNEPNIYPEWGNQRSQPRRLCAACCAQAYDAGQRRLTRTWWLIAAALAPTIATGWRWLSPVVG